MNNITKSILSFSAAGLIMLAAHEGFSSKPYLDTGGVLTNGFGNATINPSKSVTVVEALEDLKANTSSTGKAVSRCVTWPITQGQYDAYVSIAYNVGTNAFCKSTMAKLANAGDRVGSCNQFNRWTFVAGKDCNIKSSNCSGIVKRRKEEKDLCLS
jgi:GH24 family phage-related lysozyme (muramidase)